jgi:lipopolysaccharide transport system permease protein
VTVAPTRLVIEPGRAHRNYWGDLWRYRELLYFLAWRDVAVRYKQTAIGVAWAVIRPALTVLIFVGFRRMAGLSSAGPPQPVLVMAAVLPWQLFSSALTDASASVVGNANLISKIYFPRLVAPAAALATSLVDFLVTVGLLLVLMAWYGVWPSWTALALPVFILLALALSLGAGLVFAALNVKYRDFRYVVPFVVQFGLFVSPVAFRASEVPASVRWIVEINPLVGVIGGFRWAIIGNSQSLDLPAVLYSAVAAALLLWLGVWYFRRVERGFADVI